MIVETSVKVRLTDEEEECLKKASNIVNEIYNKTRDLNCEVEFENDMAYVFDDIHSMIGQFI